MHQEQLWKANIHNLTNFWKIMGFEKQILNEDMVLFNSVDWPHRVWLAWDCHPTSDVIEALLAKTSQISPAIVPVWHETDVQLTNALLKNEFEASFKQTAMALLLTNEFKHTPTSLHFVEVVTSEEAVSWTSVAAQSFGYHIPASSIQKIIGLPNLKLILAFREGVPVATGLLFENSGVIGIHMVGVLPSHRRLGIARELMYYLIKCAQKSEATHATLQASGMGEPLYEALGFEKQFVITSYVKNN